MSHPDFNPYIFMQQAVDIVGSSAHGTNKIAATIAGRDTAGHEYYFSSTNYWPPAILEKFGMETRIGNSSGTIHAETACLIQAPCTREASLFVTDPPCPNCVKNMAEAGVRALYIDHKGFEKDFALRRGDDFKNLSLHMCEKAGIDVYKIYRKDKKTEIIIKRSNDYKPPIEDPAFNQSIEQVDELAFHQNISKAHLLYGHEAFAIALCRNERQEFFTLTAKAHPMPGFTSETLEETGEKYSLILQPLNRVTMNAARKGWRIMPGFLFSSQVPTSRALVNLVGMGFTEITIGDDTKARDPSGIEALRQMQQAGIIQVNFYKKPEGS